MTNKYLLLYRMPASDRKPPSPAEMAETLTHWQAWKKAFPTILDLGDALHSTGRSLHGGVVTDGPTVESKELISGYSIIAAADYDAAMVVARGCPVAHMPGGRIEVRQLIGY